MMTNEVKNLLITVGERSIRGVVPAYVKTWDKETDQYVYSIPGEPRKLVVDPDGAINWYNSNGPEA